MKYGIDVSYCQAGFDFNQAVAEGKSFCVVRIGRTTGYGSQELDDYFIENINAAKAAGMDLGIYFYSLATTEDEAAQEALWLIDMMQTYLHGVELKAGIWLDVEENSQKALGRYRLASVIMSWVNAMNTAGYYVGVYSSYDIFTNYMATEYIPSYVPFFVANYSGTNYYKAEHPERRVLLWQYSDNGNIGGMAVDLDVMYEDGE